METLNRYATLLILVVAAGGLSTTIRRWYRALRNYGWASLSLARNLWSYAMCSGHRFPLLGAIVLPLLAGLGEARWLWKHEPYPRWLYVAGIFWTWRLVLDRVCPPAALLLAASSRRSIEAKGWLAFRLRQYRLLSFLAPREHVPSMAFLPFFKDDLRIRRGAGWRTPVLHLLDVAPVVIADVRDPSPTVEEEIRHLVRNGLGHKLRFLDEGALPPAVQELYRTAALEPIHVDGAELAGLFDERTLNIHRREHRRSLQGEYSALFREIRPAIRPDLQLREAQITAQAIMDREYHRFVREYKGMHLADVSGRLVEALPSRLSRQKEDEYLRLNRPLQIAEGIYRGMLEEVRRESGVWSAFHGASLNTKLGKLHRFRRDWTVALQHLKAAQDVLQDMWGSGSAPVDPDAVASELGDALFLEGDVWAVQFLDTGTPEQRDQALRCFEAAGEMDRRLGRQDPQIPLRVQLLGGAVASA